MASGPRVAGWRRGAKTDDAGPPAPPPLIPPGVSAVVALAAAALALIGLTGGVLVRAVRSMPGTIVMAVAALVVLAVVAERARRWVRFAAGFAMLAVVLGTVAMGATSIDERDKPSIALKATNTAATATAPGKWTITVKASASGLRAREDMLVQLQGISAGLPSDSAQFAALEPKCITTALRLPRDEALRGQYPDRAGSLLLWSQAGPSTDGSTVVESTVEVPLHSYKGVCAVAIYANSSGYAVERWFDKLQSALGWPTGNERKLSAGYVSLEAP